MNQYLITAGDGPAECQWVVVQYLEFLMSGLRKNKKEYAVFSQISGDYDGILKSCILETAIDDDLETWCGSIVWKGQSLFRPYHKRQSWFIKMEQYQSYIKSINFDAESYYFEPHKASGAGGQHVNKTKSAVRIIHPSSGLVFNVSQSRSQAQNKKIAVQQLRNALLQQQLERKALATRDLFQRQKQLERGGAVHRFKGPDFIRY